MPLFIKIATVTLLGLACLAAYGTSLQNGFLIDDALLVQQNPLIRSLFFLPQYFTQPFLKIYYRPLAYLSFALDYRVWKLNPFGYHLTALLLHLLNAVLLFALLYLLWANTALATLASLLFAVHPISNVAVNYVTERGNLLGTLFMLSALVAFCLAWKRGHAKYYLLGIFFFICSLLSHENSILFPLYLLCVSFVAYKKPDKKKFIVLNVAVILISAGYYLFRARFLNFNAAMLPVVTWQQYGQHLPTFFYVILRFVRLVLFPDDICLVAAIGPVTGFRGICYILLVLGLLLLVLIRFRKDKVVLFSLTWFFAGILPLFNMMFARPEMGLVMQVNRIYFSSIGFMVILSWCFVTLMRFLRKGLWFLLLSAILFSYMSIDLIDNAFWKDERTYCSYWLKSVPRNPYALCSLGLFYANKGEHGKADEYFWKGVDCFKIRKQGRLTQELMPGPLLGILYNDLSVNSDRSGDIDKAIAYARSAVLIDGDNSDGYYLLGCLYARKNDPDKAIFNYNESIRTNYYRCDAHRQLAVLYYAKGEKDKAREEAAAALRIDPNCFKVAP